MRSYTTIIRLFLLFTLSVALGFSQGGPFTFVSSTISNKVVGNNTNVDFTSDLNGGTSPYFLAFSSGTLPPGLTVESSSDDFAGTPTTPELLLSR